MSNYRLVITRSGAPAVLDETIGEVMHPVIGPLIESATLYAVGSQLAARLATQGPPLVLFDVGLGAGSNAAAAFAVARSQKTRRKLHIISFDRTTEALKLALEHSADFGFDDEVRAAANQLLSQGRAECGHTEWTLLAGHLPDTLRSAAQRADIVFWDPYSPRANPELWTMAAFAILRERCQPGATVHTYSAATATRSALLLAGFWVGVGQATGAKQQTTVATVPPAMPDAALDGRWLTRLARSSAPLPPDAVPDAFERIACHRQFAVSR